MIILKDASKANKSLTKLHNSFKSKPHFLWKHDESGLYYCKQRSLQSVEMYFKKEF